MALMFPAFLDKPDKISFVDQEEDEVIELFLRRHGITNFPWIVLSILGLFIPALVVFLDQALQINFISKIPEKLALEALVLWYLFIIAFVFESFLSWYFNIYIMTNQQLVDINFRSLLFRDIVTIQYNDIQGVTSQIQGIIRSFFNFGDVLVETAAKNESVDFNDVPKPDQVADRIDDLQKTMKPNAV